jgi:uncharacterized membrane protein
MNIETIRRRTNEINRTKKMERNYFSLIINDYSTS